VKRRVLTLGMALALVAVLVAPMAALASNEGTQSASTTPAATILIRNIADGADVTTITFPQAAAGATVSNPTSSASETQVLTETASEATPVAILTSDVAYKIWYTITAGTGWDATVASEKIYTQAVAAELDLATFGTSATAITVWDTPTATSPAQALDGSLDKELYLQITLESAVGKTGTSTLTVLGETP
jgi:hypothetical protein